MSNKSTKSKPRLRKHNRSAERGARNAEFIPPPAFPHKWNVLITGDLMTGKSVLARRLLRALKLERPLLTTSILVEEATSLRLEYLRQFECEHEIVVFTGLLMSDAQRLRELNIHIHQHIHIVSGKIP